jgi:hypothetical protein
VAGSNAAERAHLPFLIDLGDPVQLADEYYFVAHEDTTGKPRLHPGAVGLGSACALLTELMFAERVSIRSGQILVMDRTPPADALAHTTLDQLIREPQVRSARTWLSFFAQTATEGIAQRLLRAGEVRAERVRRGLRQVTIYVPVNMSAAAWPEHRLRHTFVGGKSISLGDAALAGIIVAIGLTDRIMWDVDAEGRRYLSQILASLPLPLRELFAHTEAAVGDAVLSKGF